MYYDIVLVFKLIEGILYAVIQKAVLGTRPFGHLVIIVYVGSAHQTSKSSFTRNGPECNHR